MNIFEVITYRTTEEYLYMREVSYLHFTDSVNAIIFAVVFVNNRFEYAELLCCWAKLCYDEMCRQEEMVSS